MPSTKLSIRAIYSLYQLKQLRTLEEYQEDDSTCFHGLSMNTWKKVKELDVVPVFIVTRSLKHYARRYGNIQA